MQHVITIAEVWFILCSMLIYVYALNCEFFYEYLYHTENDLNSFENHKLI